MNDLLVVALTITLEPLPIIGFILVLGTEGGARNGAAFIAGWVACLIAIIAATLALTGGEPVATATVPATGALVVNLVIGLGLLGLAWWRWAHPRPGPPPDPSWVQRLDRLTWRGAALLGVLLQPWPLVAVAASDILSADLAKGWTVLMLIAFVVVATGSLLIMEGLTLSDEQRARDSLDRLQRWLQRHRDRAITVLSLVIGLWLTAKGAYGLITAS